MSNDNRLAVLGAEGLAPRPGETPDRYLMRVHEGEARVMRLLGCDQPEPSADFDERFFDRFAGQRLIERAQQTEADAPEVALPPAVERLLDLDAPVPGEGFDRAFRFRLRGAMAEDGETRMRAGDALLVPALPVRNSPMFERLKQGNVFTRRKMAVVMFATAASLLVTFWFARKVEALDPPEDDVPMVATLDLLEHYDELEAFEALRDEETFEAVAMLDRMDQLDDAPARPEVKTQ